MTRVGWAVRLLRDEGVVARARDRWDEHRRRRSFRVVDGRDDGTGCPVRIVAPAAPVARLGRCLWVDGAAIVADTATR